MAPSKSSKQLAPLLTVLSSPPPGRESTQCSMKFCYCHSSHPYPVNQRSNPLQSSSLLIPRHTRSSQSLTLGNDETRHTILLNGWDMDTKKIPGSPSQTSTTREQRFPSFG